MSMNEAETRYPFIDPVLRDNGHVLSRCGHPWYIGRHTATGSPRYAHELNLPGLPSWSLTR